MNIYGKFHSDSSSKYGDIASRKLGVEGQRTDGQRPGQKAVRYTRNVLLPPWILSWRIVTVLAANVRREIKPEGSWKRGADRMGRE